MLNYFRESYNGYIKNQPGDRSFGLKQVNIIFNALKEQNYKKVEKLYLSLKNDEKFLLLESFSDSGKYINSINNWIKKEPNNHLACLFSGSVYTFIAWEIRSGSLAKDVSYEQFEGFFECLEKAKHDILKSIEFNYIDTETYARLIRIYMGLQDKESAWECFNNLMILDKYNFGGHILMFNLLTPKWLGSNEEILEFKLNAKQKENNDLFKVIKLMYIAEEYRNIDDDETDKAEVYIKKTYRKKILKTYKKINFKKIESLQRYFLHNYFAFLFYIIDEDNLRNKEIDKIGKNLTIFPWGYVGLLGLRDLKSLRYFNKY